MTAPGPTVFTVTGDWWAVNDPALSGSTSAPEMLPLNALVTFSPRLPKGFVAYTTGLVVATNVDCVQTVSLLGNPDAGTWTLSYGGYTTALIPYNASASQVQTALTALTSIGAGNATVAAGGVAQYLVTFVGTLGNKPIPAMAWDDSQLTNLGGTACNITVDITTPGSSARSSDVAVVIPPRQGRIWAGQLCSIDVADSVGVELVSNDPNLNLIDQNIPTLIYDVTFSKVQYDSLLGTLSNFAFAAPADTTPVVITDPEFPRLSWQPPA